MKKLQILEQLQSGQEPITYGITKFKLPTAIMKSDAVQYANEQSKRGYLSILIGVQCCMLIKLQYKTCVILEKLLPTICP